jgi:histidyl-tRNA synthetase
VRKFQKFYVVVDLIPDLYSYDSLITRLSQLKPKPEPICALGIQIAVEKITAALVSYQSASLKTLVKEERSFGFWSPRRCDVYVVSYQAGYLQDRLDVVSFLWQQCRSTISVGFVRGVTFSHRT